MDMRRIFLTFFGSGLSPKAPGTAGTLASMIVGIPVLLYLGAESLMTLAFAVTVAGIFEIDKYEKETGIHDPSEIVIDETAGIWLTMSMVWYAVPGYDIPYLEPAVLLLSFIWFRVFDIWKPSTIGWIDENLRGGAGVMLDDILAGVAAGLATLAMMEGARYLQGADILSSLSVL
jgi:phosphatidylglycerophosphatase A